MADFQKAWDIISTYEGAWDDKGEEYNKKDNNGHYYNNIKMGTAYGITGRFLADYVEGYFPKLPTKADLQKIDKYAAGEIWKSTVWKWMLGDFMDNQDVATIVLDWFIKGSLSVPKNLPALFGIKEGQYIIKWKLWQLGTRPKGHKDAENGFYMFTGELVFEKINKTNPKKLFYQIKAKRAPRYTGDQWRQDAFEFGNILTKTQLEAKQETKRKLMTKPTNTKLNTLYWGGVILTIGYFISRKRKKR
jgi:hypothetical protein